MIKFYLSNVVIWEIHFRTQLVKEGGCNVAGCKQANSLIRLSKPIYLDVDPEGSKKKKKCNHSPNRKN